MAEVTILQWTGALLALVSVVALTAFYGLGGLAFGVLGGFGVMVWCIATENPEHPETEGA